MCDLMWSIMQSSAQTVFHCKWRESCVPHSPHGVRSFDWREIWSASRLCIYRISTKTLLDRVRPTYINRSKSHYGLIYECRIALCAYKFALRWSQVNVIDFRDPVTSPVGQLFRILVWILSSFLRRSPMSYRASAGLKSLKKPSFRSSPTVFVSHSSQISTQQQ